MRVQRPGRSSDERLVRLQHVLDRLQAEAAKLEQRLEALAAQERAVVFEMESLRGTSTAPDAHLRRLSREASSALRSERAVERKVVTEGRQVALRKARHISRGLPGEPAGEPGEPKTMTKDWT